MSSVQVLIAVNTEGATSSDNLGSYTYMVDTRGHMGSGNEGKDELKTVCYPDDEIVWRIEPISPDANISIVSFTGQMIEDNVCQPQKKVISNRVCWVGEVSNVASLGQYQYSIVVNIGGKQMTFDPYLELQQLS